jgi:DMSO/TMAO reductase YedYZ molybdopterin-dependent catalytic subunit
VSATSRRDFLLTSLVAGGSALLGPTPADLFAAPPCQDPFAGGRYLGVVPFSDADRNPPFHTVIDSGLDARLYTDLSTLTPETLVTSNDRFFVRTSFPDLLDPGAPWSIRVAGLVKRPSAIALDDLERLTRDAAPCVMECAGNNDPRNYGLMSAAAWSGAPLTALIEKLQPLPSVTRVRISGVDRHSRRPESSLPGASWVFTLEALASGALLATRMNGEPLPRDHGRPVRLIIPGWYGCACIKWVDEIALVDDAEPATTQMREFASRTHQHGVPKLARDYAPARMDLAAMPVRIEKWLVDGRPAYRVVGIVWGGDRIPPRLRIRFRASEPFRAFDVCPSPQSMLTWSLWSYAWRPETPGLYQIVLKPDDPTIPARRLDLYFYVRMVRIDEV